MALLHRAELSPTKAEVAATWLRRQPWWTSEVTQVEQVGAYRFDDPEDAVGLEVLLVRPAGSDQVVQVPLTYRAAPLPGAEASLVTTMTHSVLGERWVHEGCADPAFVVALVDAVLTGAHEAEQVFEVDGRREVREPTARVQGSGDSPRLGALPVPGSETLSLRTVGSTSVVSMPGAEVRLHHLPVEHAGSGDTQDGTPGTEVLTGSWAGQEALVVLASVSALPG